MHATLPATWRLGYRPRVSRRGLLLAASWCVLLSYVLWKAALQHHGDAWAYYSADLSNLYGTSALGTLSYVYPPPLAQVLDPLRTLPFGAFLALLTGLEIGALVYLLGPVWAAVLVLVGPINLANELVNGNINLLIAAAVVMALRRPTWWALPLVTKVTPGVALAYHVARREWRHVAVAVGLSVAIVAISYALSPHTWQAWWTFSLTGADETTTILVAPLWLRLPAAAILAYWAGRASWRWPVPLAVVIGMPLPGSVHWVVALACIPLALDDLARRRDEAPLVDEVDGRGGLGCV